MSLRLTLARSAGLHLVVSVVLFAHVGGKPLGLTLGLTNAFAQAPSPPATAAPAMSAGAPAPTVARGSLSDSLSGEAKEAYEAGKLLFVNQIYDGASVKFERAYELSRDPRLKWNMASCARAQNKFGKAYRLVGEYQRESEGKLNEEETKAAQSLRAALELVLVPIVISVSQPGAQVTLQDESLGVTPIAEAVRVEPGVRRLIVTKEGYRTVTQDVEVGKEQQKKVDITLVPFVHEGKLVVRVPKNAAIYLDGKPVGTGQWSGSLPSGGHSLRVTETDFTPYQSEVLIEDDKTRAIDVTLDSAKRPLPWWVWVGGGVLLATGLGVGGYFILRPGPAEPIPGTFTAVGGDKRGVVTLATPRGFGFRLP
jgi:PEGA domain